ncbi:hypothetical protein DEIGR_101807 [Deinococcus grandis]|uniref:Uncharacterized protein n=1 Tax=Deinococcus grandis TaxID=57498 RepID=A0A117DQX3_9DEIO|nr:hypothetical protein [Deinococcus grandis]BBN94723.1 hypothetical protein DEGR_14560 [Deinococcus grandis]GAQ21780.1 hypothetical protein DEIGR_101807 [Deinococcus grandis]
MTHEEWTTGMRNEADSTRDARWAAQTRRAAASLPRRTVPADALLAAGAALGVAVILLGLILAAHLLTGAGTRVPRPSQGWWLGLNVGLIPLIAGMILAADRARPGAVAATFLTTPLWWGLLTHLLGVSGHLSGWTAWPLSPTATILATLGITGLTLGGMGLYRRVQGGWARLRNPA